MERFRVAIAEATKDNDGMTSEQRRAVERWIEEVKPPEVAKTAIRQKFAKLQLSVEEIDADRVAKVARMRG